MPRHFTRLVSAAVAALFAAGSAQAAVVADFELNGSAANAVTGSAVTLTNNGGALGASGITFGVNAGPTISGLGALTAYTIDIGFTLDRLTGTSGTDYVKLIDFGGLAQDAGFYSYQGYLNAFPLYLSTSKLFVAGTPTRLTLSRDNAGLITAFINGSQVYSQADPTNLTKTTITAASPLRFFTDDTTTGGREASSGFVDYIRIADTALTPGQIGPVPPVTSPVPEPATWAMMLVGFGAIGTVARRRRAAGSARVLA